MAAALGIYVGGFEPCDLVGFVLGHVDRAEQPAAGRVRSAGQRPGEGDAARGVDADGGEIVAHVIGRQRLERGLVPEQRQQPLGRGRVPGAGHDAVSAM
jgi:hypothetical protein